MPRPQARAMIFKLQGLHARAISCPKSRNALDFLVILALSCYTSHLLRLTVGELYA